MVIIVQPWVRIIRDLGGGCHTDAIKRAWYRIFSKKVMAFVNWKGVATKKHQKKGLIDSIITKAVFGKFDFKKCDSS